MHSPKLSFSTVVVFLALLAGCSDDTTATDAGNDVGVDQGRDTSMSNLDMDAKTDGTEDADPSLCVQGNHVASGACSPCETGFTRPAGDNPDGPDTACEDVCIFVLGNRCEDLESHYFKPDDNGGEFYFGTAIAIDGNTMAVGAVGDNAAPDVFHSGAVYIFRRAGANWAQEAKITANGDAWDDFGNKLALDGDTLVVGATGEDSGSSGPNADPNDNSAEAAGAVYVFTREGTTWTQEAYLKPNNSGLDDYFGGALAIDGDTLVVGAENEDSGATGVNGDGDDNSVDQAGAAYIFVRSGNTWTQQAYLKPSESLPGYFGSAVALSGDTAAIGSLQRDIVYVFTRGGDTWVQTAELSEAGTGTIYGGAIALQDGVLAVAASARVDVENAPPNPPTDSVPNRGAIYVYRQNGYQWNQDAMVLNTAQTNAGARLGQVLAMDGDLIVAGSSRENAVTRGINPGPTDAFESTVGAAFLIARVGNTWEQIAYIKAPNADIRDSFADSVAVSGNTIAFGATFEASAAQAIDGDMSDNNAPNAGAAYTLTAP